jgi:segregation and condensation protein B
MDDTQIKHVIEAALLAAGRPLSFDKIASLFATRASELDKETLQSALDALGSDYKQRGLELKEVSSGYRIQIKRSMSEWLTPLWEERAPRYTRALLETLALVAYRQPITRAEIEEVRGVAVSTNIMRTLLERSWVRVVGHRDVPGKPAMFGTTREFLDYFGLKRLEDLPALADIKDGLPELSPQTDLIDALEIDDGGEVEESAEADEQGESGEVQIAGDSAAVDQEEIAEEEDIAEDQELTAAEISDEGADEVGSGEVQIIVSNAAAVSDSADADAHANVGSDRADVDPDRADVDPGEMENDLALSRFEQS